MADKFDALKQYTTPAEIKARYGASKEKYARLLISQGRLDTYRIPGAILVTWADVIARWGEPPQGDEEIE